MAEDQTLIAMQRLPNGDLINWGRHTRLPGLRFYGPAEYYTGEAAAIMRLVLKYSPPSSHHLLPRQ